MESKVNFPVGYYNFHKNKFFNYQLNRWHSLGYARLEDLEVIGQNINSFDDYINEFTKASNLAFQEGRLKNASTYLRAAEFLIAPNSPNKEYVYKKYLSTFNKAFEEDNFERHNVPYRKSYLSAIKIPSKLDIVKGTIIGIPGFDAFIEEFYGLWNYLSYQGYNVIAFEGPGQGGSRRLYEQYFEHDFEKPTKAILDYFKIENAIAFGVSMAGYWVLRAAAFEKRITKVIAMAPVYDWLEMTNPIKRSIAKWLYKNRKTTNVLVGLKMRVPVLKHAINNALYIQNKKEPYDAVKWFLDMNKNHLKSELVTQDVLLLGGENDAFQPPILLKKQEEALVNANSVESRIFTKDEHADQHCQMGNIELPLATIVKWLDDKY